MRLVPSAGFANGFPLPGVPACVPYSMGELSPNMGKPTLRRPIVWYGVGNAGPFFCSPKGNGAPGGARALRYGALVAAGALRRTAVRALPERGCETRSDGFARPIPRPPRAV